jgi:hypothetical protein
VCAASALTPIPALEAACTFSLSSNVSYAHPSPSLRFTYSSPVTPPLTCLYHMNGRPDPNLAANWRAALGYGKAPAVAWADGAPVTVLKQKPVSWLGGWGWGGSPARGGWGGGGGGGGGGDVTMRNPPPSPPPPLAPSQTPNVDPALYRVARVWAKASDGTRIPVTLTYRPDALPMRATAPAGAAAAGPGSEECLVSAPVPCFLYAYGSYGIPMDP